MSRCITGGIMPTLPDELSTAIAAALAWLERTGTVSIWHRQALYAALGPPQPLIPISLESASPAERRTIAKRQGDQGGVPVFHFKNVDGVHRTRGHIRRTALTIQTVAYVFALWNDSRWHRPRALDAIQRIMLVVRQVYAGEQPAESATDGLIISTFDAHTPADGVHVAAGRAYDVARTDVDFQLYPLPPFRSDEELSAFRHDVAGLAAIAADSQASAFWAWWLTTALPNAWLAHPD